MKNPSQITYVDSEYSGSYSAFGVTTSGFNISLKDNPEQGSYTVGAAAIKYITSSPTATGGIGKIDLVSGGFGYKNVPGVSSVTTANGSGENILYLSQNNNNK